MLRCDSSLKGRMPNIYCARALKSTFSQPPPSSFGFAQILLTSTSLRSDPEALLALREKLFVLWGNLEELTSQRLQQASSASASTSTSPAPSSAANTNKRKRRKRPTTNNTSKSSAIPPIKRQKTDELGRPLKEEEEEEGASGNEEMGAEQKGTGKMFEACVKEYGVKDSHGKWVRIHRLSGTTIM